MGDGTVVSPSAGYNGQSVISENLKEIAQQEGGSLNHSNILESHTTQKVIGDIIEGNISNVGSVLPSGTAYGEPDYSKEPEFVVIKASPAVDLSITDSSGLHTGIIDPPDNVTDDVVTAFEERIPGSKFIQGEDSGSGPSTTIYVPRSAGNYSVGLSGNSVGTFDMSVELIKGDTVIDHVEYDAIPVLPSTVASTTISIPDLLGQSLASSSSPISIDVSGNGSTTLVVSSNKNPDPIIYFESLRQSVLDTIGSTTRAKALLKRIDHIEQQIRNGKLSNGHSDEYISERVGHKKVLNTSVNDKNKIMDMLEKFIGQFE
jgi:hypothetical protein